MKTLILSMMLFFTAGLSANVLTDTIDSIGKNFNEYRTYPRMQKVKDLISKGDLNAAKALLEKVLEIDKTNSEASKMIVILCLQEQDLSCVQKYAQNIKPIEYSKYYQANIFFNKKKYAEAFQVASSISDESSLNTDEQFQNNIIILKSAIILGNKKATKHHLDQVLHSKHSNKCLDESSNIITLLLEHNMYDEAYGEIDLYLRNCKKEDLSDKILVNWATLFRTQNRFDYAFTIINAMEDSEQKYEQQLLLYLKSNQQIKAAKTMTKIYYLNPSSKNRERLVYLYKRANMDDDIKALFAKEYQTEKNPNDLKKLLYLEKEPNKKFQLLKRYYPYQSLATKEKFNFSSSLIEHYKKKADIKHIISILDDLYAIENLNETQKLYLSHQYSQYGFDSKSIRIVESLYQKNPSLEYRKKLLFLYKDEKYNKKRKALLLSHQSKKCDRVIILSLANTKNKSPEIMNSLINYYPFPCLKPLEQFHSAMILVQYYYDLKAKQKGLKILDEAAKIKPLSSDNYLVLANWYNLFNLNQKTIYYAKEANKKNAQNIEALKMLGYGYHKLQKQALAAYYLEKASALDPSDSKLYLSLGNIYAQLSKPKEALYYWDKYQKNHYSPNTVLKSTEQALLIPDSNRAQKYMDTLKKPVQNNEYRFFMLKAKLAQVQHNTNKEIYFYEKALGYKKDKTTVDQYVYVLTRKANQLYKIKEYEQAIKYLKLAIANAPTDASLNAQLGYWYYSNGDFKSAVDAYEYTVSIDDQAKYKESLGYSYVKIDNNEKAIDSFKKSIDSINASASPDLENIYKLKRNITALDHSFSGYAAYSIRLDKYDDITNTATPVLPANYNGFASFELDYKPKVLKDYVTFYLRALAGVQDQSLKIKEGSFQPSVGIRVQPINNQNLYFSIEQFIEGGEYSRDDIMLRASWGLFDGYDFHPTDSEYSYNNLYLDSVYFMKEETYSVYGNYEYGHVWKINYENALMPYLCTSIAYSNDNIDKKTTNRFDIGVGLSYLFWLNERPYQSHQYTGRFKIELRQVYHGNTEDKHAAKATLEFLF